MFFLDFCESVACRATKVTADQFSTPRTQTEISFRCTDHSLQSGTFLDSLNATRSIWPTLRTNKESAASNNLLPD